MSLGYILSNVAIQVRRMLITCEDLMCTYSYNYRVKQEVTRMIFYSIIMLHLSLDTIRIQYVTRDRHLEPWLWPTLRHALNQWTAQAYRTVVFMHNSGIVPLFVGSQSTIQSAYERLPDMSQHNAIVSRPAHSTHSMRLVGTRQTKMSMSIQASNIPISL